MTPLQVLARRENRIDALIDRVESGQQMTDADWQQLDQLNILDLMSVNEGASRQILELENDADGVADDRISLRTE
jgi:hypothetical protein